jgi:hypothetical protein
MQPEEYPPQEPLSAPAQQYQAEVNKRAATVTGIEHQYGPVIFSAKSAIDFAKRSKSSDGTDALNCSFTS